MRYRILSDGETTMGRQRKASDVKFKPKMKSTKFDYTKLTYMLKELEYGMDVQANTIFLNSEISTDSMYETLSRFNFLAKTNKGPIHLNVSSFGGDVYSMFGIHDYMRTLLPVKVDTICVGPAMSAAAFLLASGTGERLMTRNSTVMFHQFTGLIEGKTTGLIANTEHIKGIQERANELLGEYTKKSKTYWQKMTKDDFYLTAERCLEYGVIDRII